LEYLTSWKAIAHYLHSGVRTVQRYESDNGFPVRRLAGSRRGTVIATTEEVDAWIRTSSSVRSHAKVRANGHWTKQKARLDQGVRRMIELQKQARYLQAENISAWSRLSVQISKLRSSMAYPSSGISAGTGSD
jgi:hypothetical protein